MYQPQQVVSTINLNIFTSLSLILKVRDHLSEKVWNSNWDSRKFWLKSLEVFWNFWLQIVTTKWVLTKNTVHYFIWSSWSAWVIESLFQRTLFPKHLSNGVFRSHWKVWSLEIAWESIWIVSFAILLSIYVSLCVRNSESLVWWSSPQLLLNIVLCAGVNVHEECSLSRVSAKCVPKNCKSRFIKSLC